jgi:hypothetical protein
MGQSEVLLGICWGTHWELDGNIMKTLWEYIENNPQKIPKNPAPSPIPKVYFPPFFGGVSNLKHPSERGIEFLQTPPLFIFFPMIPGKHLLGMSRSIKQKQSEQVYMLGKALSNGPLQGWGLHMALICLK